MYSDRRNRKEGKIASSDAFEIFGGAMIGLCFPPARNALAVAEIFNNLFHAFLRNLDLMSDLRTNAVKFMWCCEF